MLAWHTQQEENSKGSGGYKDGKGYLTDLVLVPSGLLQADVVKPGIVVERVLLHLTLILEAPLIHHHVLPQPTRQSYKI